MYSIGEFSKATGLTVKALRFYHDQNVLIPKHVDPENGYRYYHLEQVETASVIVRLRELDLSVKQIAEIVRQCEDESDFLETLERKLDQVVGQLDHLNEVRWKLESIINTERENKITMNETREEIIRKQVDPVLIAGIRMKGRYSDCGRAFGKIGRHFGRKIKGKAMMLCYDSEFKEDDADFEPCMPIRDGESKQEVVVHRLAGGHCISLVHRGPYDSLKHSYERLLRYSKEHELTFQLPSREIYHKGPGMIFSGNPKKYVTEIQMFLAE